MKGIVLDGDLAIGSVQVTITKRSNYYVDPNHRNIQPQKGSETQ